MLNNNMNPMMNNMNPNMLMFNPMMNNMNQNMLFNPMMNNMNQNMNQMNMMCGNMNNLNQSMNKEINIIIKSENNELNLVSCLENDTVDTLYNKFHLIKGSLAHDYRILWRELTLKDNGIINGAIISIKSDCKNIIFKTTKGTINTILLAADCPLNVAIMIYASEIKTQNIYDKIINKTISFIYNGTMLRINDETPIQLIFNFEKNPKVVVNYLDDLIGG